PAGCLLAARFDAFLAGGRDFAVLFAPDRHTALSYHSRTRHHLILTLLADVRSRQEVIHLDGPRPRSAALDLPDLGHTDVLDTHPDNGDEYLLYSSGFIQPPTLHYGQIAGAGAATGHGSGPDLLKRAPAYFDAAGMSVRQFFATSADGTS